MNNECLDGSETKSYGLDKTGGDITFKGWNIKNPEKIILEELKDYFENDNVLDLKIIGKKEHAYSCNKWCEGSDAKDEGFSYWLKYENNYKKGLGKCTTFTISYNLKEVKEE